MATVVIAQNAISSTADADAVWESRIRRLRDYARRELRKARVPRRSIDLDELVQEALVAWLKSGVTRHEFISPVAMRSIEAQLAAASKTLVRSVDPHQLDVRSAPPNDPTLDEEDERDLRHAIAALPPHLRSLAHVRLLGTRPTPNYATLARERRCTITNVKHLSHRALRIVIRKIRHARAVRCNGMWTPDLEIGVTFTLRPPRSRWVPLREGLGPRSLNKRARGR